MAYINVAEWTPDQVTEWLKGLDDSMYNYLYTFTNNEVGGHQLLNIRPYELEHLGMHSIGHQEIVLEAVENLRNFHYNLDKENLQFMALHIATAARSLHRQLVSHCDASKIETQILYDITRTIGTMKPLISWLERSPFQGQFQFTEICRNMLRLGLEMATIAQRDRFVDRPVDQIRGTVEKLERLANYIIQDITDPMLLQPASLNLVTLKKRESELGFNIETSFHGIHRVTDIKYNSPAHNSAGKIEDGDEIVQINYQTVVGWQYKNVIGQLRESMPDVLLTLKKRPKHTKIYGQIYMQPYRLPSKKRAMGTRWGENLPSPRAGFLAVPESVFNHTLPIKNGDEKAATAAASSDSESSCSDILTPTDTKTEEKEIRLYYPKPRAMLQRRNTICGSELMDLKSGSNGRGRAPLWHERSVRATRDPSSPSLRDKSISFGFGLEITPRPTTCIGIAAGNTANKYAGEEVNSFLNESKNLKHIPEATSELQTVLTTVTEEKSKPGVSKVVRFDANMKYEDYPVDEKYTCNVENTILETFEPIPFADEEDEDMLNAICDGSDKTKDLLESLEKVSLNSVSFVEAINIPAVSRRGRLDKSHSTPAYDNSGEESDTPPAIEPRKEFLLQTPPVPPPRPRKQKDFTPTEVPPPPPKPPGLMASLTNQALNAAILSHNAVNQAAITVSQVHAPPLVDRAESAYPAASGHTANTLAANSAAEVNELLTPSKTKNLTLKKKHSLILKRRNINLKILGTGDIQGHLYRRTKDRRGVTYWARLYFVMLETMLYGFRSKVAPKASCVIFLPGFTVSIAKEVHSKPYAFKVYHSAKTFYFATESQDALNQWIDFIRQATLHALEPGISLNSNINPKDLFSETDSSGEESETVITQNLCTPSPQTSKDINTAQLPSSKCSNTPTSTKTDRRYLGSLRKLTKASLPFKSSSSNEKKNSSDIPVPTDQYRSYRKVPGGSFGIQIGTNTPGFHDTSLHPYNVNSLLESTPITENTTAAVEKNLMSTSRTSLTHTEVDAAIVCLQAPTMPATPPTIIHKNADNLMDTLVENGGKKVPYNFIHASNPNLVEFDFQTSKTLDYSLPKINSANSWEAQHSIQGFVTLKDLMLQKQEEEAQEMYNNRVLLGVEKNDERRRNTYGKYDEDNKSLQHGQAEGEYGATKVPKTQRRSLPKTPDYEISFKPDDEDIKRTRTKEGLKLRDFGYELISGDEPVSNAEGSNSARTSIHSATGSTDQHDHHSWTASLKARHLLKSQQLLLTAQKNKHKHSNASITFADDAGKTTGDKRTGSFKKKGKLEAIKSSSERLFQFSKHSATNSTSSGSGVTMTLPLNKKSHNNLGDGALRSTGGIKKSLTYNNDFKDKPITKYDGQRKNSAPMPIFVKLPFSTSNTVSPNITSTNSNNKVSKEKRLLGSPLLHRTLFGNQQYPTTAAPTFSYGITPTCSVREYDQEIFSQVVFPKGPTHHHQKENTPSTRKLSTAASTSHTNITAPDVEAPPPPTAARYAFQNSDSGNTTVTHHPFSKSVTPDYPDMVCPPVFEPEIYSLSDPNNSLLLRRKNSKNANGSDGLDK